MKKVVRSAAWGMSWLRVPLKNLPAALKSATQPAQLEEKLREAFAIQTQRDLADFARFADGEAAAAYNEQIGRLGEGLQSSHLLSGADYSRAYHEKDAEEVRVDGGKFVGLRPNTKLISLDNSRGVDAFLASASAAMEPAVRDNVLHYLQRTFTDDTPLYRLDARATEALEEAAREAVPPATEPVLARSLLVRGSTHRGLSDAELSLLAAEHAEYLRQQNDSRPWRRLWIFLGRAGMIAAVFLLACLYIYRYQRSILKSPLRSLAVAALLALMLLLAKVMVASQQSQIAFRATVEVRNRLVQAYQDVMNMPL